MALRVWLPGENENGAGKGDAASGTTISPILWGNTRLRFQSTPFLFNQPGDFSIFRESLSFNVLLGKDQPAVTLDIKNTTTAFDRLNIRIRIWCLQFSFHPGSLRDKISTDAVYYMDVHKSSFIVYCALPHILRSEALTSIS